MDRGMVKMMLETATSWLKMMWKWGILLHKQKEGKVWSWFFWWSWEVETYIFWYSSLWSNAWEYGKRPPFWGILYGLLSQLEKPMRKSPLPEVLQRDCRSPSCQALLLLLQWPDATGSQGNPQDVNTVTRFLFQVMTSQHSKILDSKERFPQHFHRW